MAGVVQAGRAQGRRRTSEAFPDVQGNVMMIAPRGEKNRAIAEPLHDLESENASGNPSARSRSATFR